MPNQGNNQKSLINNFLKVLTLTLQLCQDVQKQKKVSNKFLELLMKHVLRNYCYNICTFQYLLTSACLVTKAFTS